MSNAGGMSTVTRYTDMLAGNTTWTPWTPEGAYDALATVNISTATSSVTFAGIPTGYKHLQIRFNVLPSLVNQYSTLRFNGDTTTSNYRYHYLVGQGSGSGAAGTAQNAYSGTYDSTSSPGSGILDILDYSSSVKNKTTRELSGYDGNGAGNIYLISNVWMSTAPITSINLTIAGGNYAVNTQFALYGVK
jgi:hypothetical protein